MSAKSFNEDWQKGQTAAGKRLPALQRKYEAVLRKNAKKTAARYATVTAAAQPSEDPSMILDETGLKVAITARTAAERKRMAKLIATPLVASPKPALYEATLHTLANVQAEAATKAVRDALVKIIADSLEQGWTVPETATQIETKLTDYATWEATRLARSDLVGISNSVSLNAAQSLGDAAPRFKRWLTAGDGDVREIHREAEGQTVGVDKPFLVGGFPMDHPGDPLSPYENWLNCRCTQIYMETANASTAHSFEGGNVEDPIANASDDIQEALAAASVDFTESSMIAIYPGGPDRFQVDGGQPEETIHVTLCFLPNGVDGDREALVGFLGDIAGMSAPLEGEVGGMGYFSPGQDGMPVIALPDVVGLNELRTAVAAATQASGTTYATSHGFLPHITIAYVEDATAETPDLTGLPLEFPALALVEGEATTLFPFSASDLEGNLDDVDALSAATFSAKQRDKLAEEGVALPDGSFPIRNKADLSNAIASLGRAKDVAKAKKHIVARARDLDALDALPESWGITASAIEILTEESDPWYAEETTAPVAAIVAEREKLFKGNTNKNRRFAVEVPPEYDGVRAAREMGLRAAAVEEEIDAPEAEDNARVAEDLCPGCGAGVGESHEDDCEEALTAAAAPIDPPDEWFEDPEFDAPTPLTVTADGRVMGHLGEWGKCHTGIGGRCVMIPRSQTGYADFHNGGMVTASGKEIRVGKITLDTGHAPLQAGASRAAAHYDHTGHVGAFVRAGEDQFGPWLAGAVRSDATPEQIRDLRANPPSGDWRKLHGRHSLELIAALAVPVQGFPVAALAASGELTGFIAGWGDTGDLALVASGEPEEMEREWDIIVARLDGINGLAALVASNDRHDDHGRFDTALERARAAKGLRNSNELDNPPVMRNEVGRVEAPGAYGESGFKPGERVRTAEGHAGMVEGDSHSGSQVRVRHEVGGHTEMHDVGSLRREGPRAALPPRDRGNLVAATITIETGESPTLDIGDGKIDRELGLQIAYFRDHGYWPSEQLSASGLTDDQMTMVQTLGPLMIDDPDSEVSIALRGRLDNKGLLV